MPWPLKLFRSRQSKRPTMDTAADAASSSTSATTATGAAIAASMSAPVSTSTTVHCDDSDRGSDDAAGDISVSIVVKQIEPAVDKLRRRMGSLRLVQMFRGNRASHAATAPAPTLAAGTVGDDPGEAAAAATAAATTAGQSGAPIMRLYDVCWPNAAGATEKTSEAEKLEAFYSGRQLAETCVRPPECQQKCQQECPPECPQECRTEQYRGCSAEERLEEFMKRRRLLRRLPAEDTASAPADIYGHVSVPSTEPGSCSSDDEQADEPLLELAVLAESLSGSVSSVSVSASAVSSASTSSSASSASSVLPASSIALETPSSAVAALSTSFADDLVFAELSLARTKVRVAARLEEPDDCPNG